MIFKGKITPIGVFLLKYSYGNKKYSNYIPCGPWENQFD